MGLEKNCVFKCSFVIRQICLLNEPLLQCTSSAKVYKSQFPFWSFTTSYSGNPRQLAVCAHFVVNLKYLFNPIHVQIGSALPTTLRIQTTHSTPGMRWHSAYHHRRAPPLLFVVSLHCPFLLALQLMDIQMGTELTRSHCCWLPLEALCASVLVTCWQECGEVTRTLWSRHASCVCVCVYYYNIKWEKVIQVAWSKWANVCLPITTLPVRSDNLSSYPGVRNYQWI